MSNVSGVSNVQQVNSVQVQWNSKKPLECALGLIYGASAYLAFSLHPWATPIGFVMALPAGKTKSVQLPTNGFDAISEEMARREKLISKLAWGVLGLGFLYTVKQGHYSNDLLTTLVALSAGGTLCNFLRKQLITPLVVEPVSVTVIEQPSQPETQAQEQEAPLIHLTRISLHITLGKEDADDESVLQPEKESPVEQPMEPCVSTTEAEIGVPVEEASLPATEESQTEIQGLVVTEVDE